MRILGRSAAYGALVWALGTGCSSAEMNGGSPVESKDKNPPKSIVGEEEQGDDSSPDYDGTDILEQEEKADPVVANPPSTAPLPKKPEPVQQPVPDPSSQPIANTGSGEECLDGAGGNFIQDGPYGAKTGISKGGHSTYIPSNFQSAGCKHPVIVFAMGTGAPAMSYTKYYRKFASYGFVVVVDSNKSAMNGGARTLKAGVDWLYTTEYASHLVEKVGVTGHSQGGGAAFVAGSHNRVAAVVGLQPAQFGGGGGLKTPYLGLAGTRDNFGQVTNPKMMHWRSLQGPGFYANLEGADHMRSATMGDPHASQYAAISTAWFRCYLSNDQQACSLFNDNSCSQFAGTWAECDSKNM